MTIRIEEFEKILDETYDRMFGDFTKIIEEVQHERNKEHDRLGKDIKPESKDKKKR